MRGGGRWRRSTSDDLQLYGRREPLSARGPCVCAACQCRAGSRALCRCLSLAPRETSREKIYGRWVLAGREIEMRIIARLQSVSDPIGQYGRTIHVPTRTRSRSGTRDQIHTWQACCRPYVEEQGPKPKASPAHPRGPGRRRLARNKVHSTN